MTDAFFDQDSGALLMMLRLFVQNNEPELNALVLVNKCTVRAAKLLGIEERKGYISGCIGHDKDEDKYLFRGRRDRKIAEYHWRPNNIQHVFQLSPELHATFTTDGSMVCRVRLGSSNDRKNVFEMCYRGMYEGKYNRYYAGALYFEDFQVWLQNSIYIFRQWCREQWGVSIPPYRLHFDQRECTNVVQLSSVIVDCPFTNIADVFSLFNMLLSSAPIEGQNENPSISMKRRKV